MLSDLQVTKHTARQLLVTSLQ